LKIRRIARDQRRVMDERLGGNHSIKELAPRISGDLEDRAVGIGACIVEGEDRQCFQDRIETCATHRRGGWIPGDPAFQFHPRHN